MESKVYPNLEEMCRLCLKENSGTICIFPSEESPEKNMALSIPMRIMTCAALEVQSFDAFPKKICSECRLQLEKSYYFRKLSQTSDAKIRKHLRLLGMGKTSKVFNKKIEEDDDDDDMEFQDSINFIREQESQQKQMEKSRIDTIIHEIKSQNEKDLEIVKRNLRASCREELIPEVREELRKQLQTEIKNDLEESIRKSVTEQCINQAKESLRTEVREECRKLEIKCILEDLQTYLNNKNKTFCIGPSAKVNMAKRSISPLLKKQQPSKIKCIAQNPSKIEVVRMELELRSPDGEKVNVPNENIVEEYQNQNDEESESERNFLIYDMESFGIQKKSSDQKFEYEDNVIQEVEYEDEEYVAYEKASEENIEGNDDTGETTSTTSYQIEDNEDGEIKLLKKIASNNAIAEDKPDHTNDYKNIMVIKIDEGIDNELVEHFEEVEEKNTETNTNSSNKIKKSSRKKTEASKVTRTTSSVLETTFLTKTYVNPLQRCTDTPKLFKCKDCPMVFSTQPSLERHIRTHQKTGEAFQCPECFIVVSCSSALRRHMYVHCEEKPFACSLCDKAFVQKEILKRHMQTHTGIKPHQCPHCERSFAQRINLTQHINRTHAEQPHIQQYSCHLCPKRFNHASGLSRHLASHGGVAFQCSECDRTFGDRSSIRRHILNMHSNSRLSKDDAKAKVSNS